MQIRNGMRPDWALALVDARFVTGLLGLFGDLFRSMLYPVEDWTAHPAHDERREQEPYQYGTTLVHQSIGHSFDSGGSITTPPR